MADAVSISLDDRGVMTITLNQPDKRNVLSRSLVAALSTAMERVDNDDGVRVAVLTNAGSVFCAGADLSERSERSGPPTDADSGPDPSALFGRIRNSPKPWVGRIAGHCVAGGLGLAASCDIAVGLNDAKFGFTEARIGVAPAVISVVCLPKMRPSEAAEAFLRANRFDGARAAELGLLTRAVGPDELDDEIDGIINDVLECSPGALAACKQLLADVPQMPIDDAFAWAGPFSASLFASDDAAEGMAAYLDKRPPRWSPRAGRHGAS